MHSKNIFLFSLLVILASVYVNAQIAIKKKAVKSKIKKGKLPLSLPVCGCQAPVIEILTCGCRSPLDVDFTVPTLDVCGCQQPLADMSYYRYANPLQINPMNYLPPVEVPNYGFMQAPVGFPRHEYVSSVDMACSMYGSMYACRPPPVQIPAYPYAAPVDAPMYGLQEMQMPPYPYGGYVSGFERPVYAMPVGCAVPPPVRQIALPCGNAANVCSCQQRYPCGSPVSCCGCPSPVRGCQVSSYSCGGPGPVGGCQARVETPAVGQGCGCGMPNGGCSGGCGRNYLRQVALQPPFL